MDLRRVLLEGNYENVKESFSSMENTKENYDFLCELYTECEVKGISLDPKTVQLIIDFVVGYRLKYSDEHGMPEKYEENLNERLNFLEQIVGAYLEHKYENLIEEIVFLKCVARTLKPILSKNHPLKVPWQKVQFIICIFVAVKSNRKRHHFKFIDAYFQLLVDEDLIRDMLQLMLNCLKDRTFDDENWKKFNNTHSILQMYYLLLKTVYYYELIDKTAVISDKALDRCLQMIGECCLQMSKLQYEGFDYTIYPLCDVQLFSAELSHERDKFSHFEKLRTKNEQKVLRKSNTVLLNKERICLFITDMVQMIRKEIVKIVVEETVIEKGDVEKLFKRVKNMKNIMLKNHFSYKSEHMDNEVKILSKCGLIDNRTNILQNSNVFCFIQWLQMNFEKPVYLIKDELNAIFLKTFKNISTLKTLTHIDYSSSHEDSIIKEFLENIHGFITNPRDKEKLYEIENILMKKRSLVSAFKKVKDVELIIMKWPKDNENQKVTKKVITSYNDLLNIFVDFRKNISDYKKIDIFLNKIGWENRKAIVDEVRKDIFNDLTNSLETVFYNIGEDEIVDEINLLNCLEILKKMEIVLSQDYNYLDFDCSIPVARNMRNYLAHGEIYVEIFCPNLKEIIQSHLKIISKSYKDIKRIGFWRPEDFETVQKDLNKHRKWAREVWESSAYESNILFEKKLKEGRNYNCIDNNTVDLFIDKFLKEPVVHEKIRLLCIIICFNYKKLHIFHEVYSNHFITMEINLTFLYYTMAHNLLEISDFLLKQLTVQEYTEKYSIIEFIIKHALEQNNNHLITNFIDNYGYFIQLEFILKKNSEPRNSLETMTSLLNYLNNHNNKRSFSELLMLVTESRIRKKGLLLELFREESNQEDFDFIIIHDIHKKCFIYVKIALRKELILKEGMKNVTFLMVFQIQEQVLKLFKEHRADLQVKYNFTLLDMEIKLWEGNITVSMGFLSKYKDKSYYVMDFYNSNTKDLLLFEVIHESLSLTENALSSGANTDFKYEKFRYGTILHVISYPSNLKEDEFLSFLLNLGLDFSIILFIHNYLGSKFPIIYEPLVKIINQVKLSAFHLFWAGVLRKDIDLMEEALDRGADVNSVFPGLECYTALHLLSEARSLEAVQFLLNNGALKANNLQQYQESNSELKKLFFKSILVEFYKFKIP